MTYLINPNFLCRSLTGIERFAFETCRNLDSLLTSEDDVHILIPSNAKTVPIYKNIKTIMLEKPIKSFPRWDLFEFEKYCKKYKATGVNFSNTAPIGKACGISFIHDIYAKVYPGDFSSKKEKLIKAYSCFCYKNIAKNAKKVLTVSEFSKNQIKEIYKIPESKISVIPNGWEHFNQVQEEIIEDSDGFLTPKSYYFTLGSLQKRKNLAWIAKYAKNHPEEKFAVSGKIISGFESSDISALKELPNVKLLGYVSDGQVKYLMKNCKAFVFPSYYEGFGIPPLEALSAGAKIIISKAASLPEIYGNSAHYIDFNDPNVNLTELLKEDVESPEKVLNKYTYQNAAKALYSILLHPSR